MDEKKISTVVWDVDNTLWDWITMHLAGMSAMSGKISEITKVPEDEVRESMKKVYRNAKTFDYKALVQELDVVHKWAAKFEDVRTIVEKSLDLGFSVHAAYTHARNENFKLYESIAEVLSGLVRVDIRNVIVSDAPLSKVLRRLKLFNLDGHFDMVCGRRDSKTEKEMESGEHLSYYEKTRRASGLYKVAIPDKNIVFLDDEKKPDINLARLLSISPDEVPEKVAVVGDSFPKDMVMAHKNNCYGIFAGYGVPDILTRYDLYKFGPKEVVARNSAEITPENAAIIKLMGDKFNVAKETRDVLRYILPQVA